MSAIDLPAVSLDLETFLIAPGNPAPPIVCGSLATEDGESRILSVDDVRKEFPVQIERASNIIGANIAFDFGVLAADPELARQGILEKIFKAYEKGRVFDILIAQALDGIAKGCLFKDPRDGGPIRDPGTGKIMNRYSLAVCTDLTLNRKDAKKNDFWRLRYGILAQVPMDQWPDEAKQYPVDDVENTLEVAVRQAETFENLNDMAAQAETAWDLHLASMQGHRTDPEKVEKLAADVEAKHAAAVKRFTGVFLREDGSEDQAAVKRAVANAYGASGKCPRCTGSGKVKSEASGNPVICKAKDGGCDGTGLDITTAPTLPRTPTGGISADRDCLMESGDELLSEYALVSETEKVRDTYLPFLRACAKYPSNARTNVLLENGRTSTDGLTQLFPRGGGIRETFVAPYDPEDPWVICSIDYAALELVTLAQVCLWIVGYSKMAETINEYGDPGALHTAMAAKMLGTTYEDMSARIKSGDKTAKGYRQAAKACFHPDTEILTRKRGWVRVSELTMDDEVASVTPHDAEPPRPDRRDPKTGRMLPAADGRNRDWYRKNSNSLPLPSMEVVWTKPIRLTTRKAEEGLVHIQNEGIDLRVTPDHRMLVYGTTKRTKVVEARDFGKQRGWFNAGVWDGGEIEVDERLLRLAVATQADGNYEHAEAQGGRRIRFGFSKARKIERLLSLLRPGEYEVKDHKNGKAEKRTTSIKLSDELSEKIKALLDSNKTLPWWWLELKPHLRNAVLDEVRFWDSHQGPKLRCYLYSTVIKKNVDVLQALASITGRKTAHYVEKRENPNHKDCHGVTVRAKADTRGENVTLTKLDYDGDVFCLSVPSSFVLVRDGGIPVVVGQCNFGLPGGMGAAKLVIAKRKRSEGETVAPDGTVYTGIRFCVTVGGAERCGIEKVTEWKGRPLPPTCKACIVCAEDLRNMWFGQWTELRPYFSFVSNEVDTKGQITQFISNRIRGGIDFTNAANGYFSALAADGAKSALRKVTRECYLDRRSPMYGARPYSFVHDEILSYQRERTAHLSAPRMSEVMRLAMQEYTPDVTVACAPALMRYWDKNAEPVYDANGKLLVWEPKK